MRLWPDPQALSAAEGAGVSIDGTRWLSQRHPLAVGADNISFECAGVEGSPQPVRVHLIQEKGIPIIEWVNCETLAADEIYEFLFLCLPLTVAGATDSLADQ